MVEDKAEMLLVMEYMEGGPVLPRGALAAGATIPEAVARAQFRDMCKVRHMSRVTCYRCSAHACCCCCCCRS